MSKVVPIRARYEAGYPDPYLESPPASLSADAEVANAGRTLRDWSRHLAANSATCISIFDSRVCDGVGTGLVYQPMVRTRGGELHKHANAEISRFMKKWRRKPDVTGQMSAGKVERLVWRLWDVDGEVFVREVVFPSDKRMPYRVQIIESDMVPYSIMTQDRQTVMGIEMNDWGMPRSYLVMKQRRGDIFFAGTASYWGEYATVNADLMAHLKITRRGDQARGIPLVHGVVFNIADLSEYIRSHRLAARATTDLFASINRGPDWEPTLDADGNVKKDRDWYFEHMQILDGLSKDEMVNFHSPQHPNQNAVEFVREEKRAIAAGTRTGFSVIAQVFDRSFAAQRLERVQNWRYIEQDRDDFVSTFALPMMYERPVEWGIKTGAIKLPRGIDEETILDVEIDGPVMPTIDPVNDRKAWEMDQENEWDSRRGIMRKKGANPEHIDPEISQDPYYEKQQQKLTPQEPAQDDDED